MFKRVIKYLTITRMRMFNIPKNCNNNQNNWNNVPSTFPHPLTFIILQHNIQFFVCHIEHFVNHK